MYLVGRRKPLAAWKLKFLKFNGATCIVDNILMFNIKIILRGIMCIINALLYT